MLNMVDVQQLNNNHLAKLALYDMPVQWTTLEGGGGE